jgi:hypothetical protein
VKKCVTFEERNNTMKKIHKELCDNWFETIKECYVGDDDLINKYHILAPTTIELATANTVQVLVNAGMTNKYTLYSVFWKGELMGYYGIEIAVVAQGKVPMLTGFCIKKQFRSKEMKKKFFDIVREHFVEKRILTAIYDKNTRALSFISKNGGEVIHKANLLVDGIGYADFHLVTF